MTRTTPPPLHTVPPAIAAQKAAMELLLTEVQALCALMQGRLPSFTPPTETLVEDDPFDNLPV